MNEFDKIIRQKAEQFEVPFNDAHWAEMEAKLNKIKATKIKNTILGVATGVVAISIATYLILSSPTNTKQISDKTIDTKNELVQENTTEVTTEKNQIKPEITESNTPKINHPSVTKIEENNSSLTDETIKTENTIVDKDKNRNNENLNNTTIQNTPQTTLNNSNITPDFIVYNNKVCLGEKVEFEAFETDAQVSYLWNFGDGEISTKTNPTHVYTESMPYTVTLTLIDNQTGKEYTAIKHDAVTILPLPDTQFTYLEESKKNNDNKLSYPYTLFNIVNIEKGATYKWNFGNQNKEKQANTKTIYEKSGNYTITLIAEGSNGCIKTIQKRVNIEKGVNLYAPTAFTPNLDGKNDNFIPKALIEWEIPFEMVITNKEGHVIYKTNNKNEPWNGNLNNSGQLQNEGIYFWQVIITDAYSVKHLHTGNIQLLR